ncbi:hypothetical protein M426DRAFT_12003 [Hypoxylon sp. CI-4A]|nr:hypothetical protein M426DRAFT_12003 [Hypoxylon sp. CI-4A]
MASGTALNVVNWVGAGLSIVVFAARGWTRVFIVRSIGPDDLFMFLSLLFSLAAAILITISVHYGMGSQDAITALASKYSFLSGIPVLISQSFGRISFALTLLAVLGKTRTRQWFLYIMIASQFILLVIDLALSYGLCRPLSGFWDTSLSETEECLATYHRVIVDGWNYFQTAWDAGSDFALALLPGLIFRTMNLHLRLKIGLSILMGLGVLTGICSIVKAIEFSNLYTGNPNSGEATVFIWTVVQEYIVIIAASLPYCRAFFTDRGDTSVGNSNEPGAFTYGRITWKPKSPRVMKHPEQVSSGLEFITVK